MIRLAGWQKWWFERDAHKQTKEAYASMRASYAVALRTLDEANRREADLREYVNLVELERDDARREVDEVRAALLFVEGNFFRKDEAS